jgi:hypothetical protein
LVLPFADLQDFIEGPFMPRLLLHSTQHSALGVEQGVCVHDTS